MEFITTILGNYDEILAAGLKVIGSVSALLSALYALALLIPGDQPDKFIEGLLEFTEKYSKK